jgi:YggT family protein
MGIIVSALGILVQILIIMIIIRALISFIPQFERSHPLVHVLDQVVDPILRPFQRLRPAIGGLDFSPLLAILTLQVAFSVISQLLLSLGR